MKRTRAVPGALPKPKRKKQGYLQRIAGDAASGEDQRDPIPQAAGSSIGKIECPLSVLLIKEFLWGFLAASKLQRLAAGGVGSGAGTRTLRILR